MYSDVPANVEMVLPYWPYTKYMFWTWRPAGEPSSVRFRWSCSFSAGPRSVSHCLFWPLHGWNASNLTEINLTLKRWLMMDIHSSFQRTFYYTQNAFDTLRRNAFCMVFHARWIFLTTSLRIPPACDSGGIRRWVVRNPSHMENHTKCIFSHILHFKAR